MNTGKNTIALGYEFGDALADVLLNDLMGNELAPDQEQADPAKLVSQALNELICIGDQSTQYAAVAAFARHLYPVLLDGLGK